MRIGRSGRAATAVAVVVLAGTLTAGCGGDDDDDEGGGLLGKRPGRGEPSATAPGPGSSSPRAVRGGPLRFVAVEQERPGACATESATSFTDEASGSCLTVASGGGGADGMLVTGTLSSEAKYDAENGSGWIVNIELTSGDAKRFADLTGRLAGRTPPANQLAVIRGHELLSAPSVLTAITGGKVQISGSFTRESAERLAHDLGGG
ncbi:SecDF P1 head subdomain-containing protein [Streptomyces sp. P1-3]|uniref:SecDF P1 head subdomain-containing protein n=1 Tax=Streptomyces sp. P1-3 TaxID=3421658 RepID=UPI003D365BE5